jgi:hypothetical protein
MVSRIRDALDTRPPGGLFASELDAPLTQSQRSAAAGGQSLRARSDNETTSDDQSCRRGLCRRWLRRVGRGHADHSRQQGGVSVTVAPDSDAHRHIDTVAPRYRTFALIAHLRDTHGLAEVVPERAAIAHSLFTRHEMALALPIASHRRLRRRPSLQRRRKATGSPVADATSLPAE